MAWLDEVVAVVDYWMGVEGRRTSRRAPIQVGAARRDAMPGWYVVDLRGTGRTPEQLDDLCLVGDGQTHRVLEMVMAGEILRVRVGAHVIADELTLRATPQPAAFLLQKLRDGLKGLTNAGLADSLARGRLTDLPASTSPWQLGDDWHPGQRQAFAACLTPGLYLVWGPPGTGKTRVLVKAIAHLVAGGKRVLLASATNMALDNALAGVIRERRWQPGQLVRVGTPHLRKIADNHGVSLSHLTTSRIQDREELRKTIAHQLSQIGEHERDLNDLDVALHDYDPAAYEQASLLIAAEARINDLRQLVAARADVANVAERDRMGSEHRLREADVAWDAIATERDHLAAAAKLRQDLQRLEEQSLTLRTEELRLDAERASLAQELHTMSPIRFWARQRRERQLAIARAELHEATECARRGADTLAQKRAVIESDIARHEATAGAVDDAEVARRCDELDRARDRHASLLVVARAAQLAVQRAQGELRAAEAASQATDEHRRIVAEAEAAAWPAAHVRRAQLRAEVEAGRAARANLERQHEQLVEEMEQLRRDAEGEIIRGARLVATTLARFRLKPAVLAGPYDAVLIDEVGTATIPEVLLAVSRAKSTAVLLGDFLQLGAVRDDDKLDTRRQDVKRWLLRDCFELCGIDSPQAAEESPGCAALTIQHRFGPVIMDLANRTVYEDRLDGVREGSEIVLLDTDGLGDLGTVRATGPWAGWWPAGSLLGAILAQHHADRGESVGVIAPYRDQAEVALEALRGLEGSQPELWAEAATAHRMQGREFEVVVFDLVEDGGRPRWMSSACPDGKAMARTGARLFNVAATRARHRLYLVGSRGTIARAGRNTTLAVVRAMIAEGKIEVLPASTFLAPAGGDVEVSGVIGAELADTFAQYVRVADIHDEHTYFDALARYLDEGREHIWIWAPWVGNRMSQVLPRLTSAIERGVRVTVFVRPRSDWLQERMLEQLRALRAAVPNVVAMDRMHQKIVVVDHFIALVGSVNTLSHSRSREVMLAHQGSGFIRRLLKHEHAEAFSKPPKSVCSCPGSEIALWQPRSFDDGWGWWWRCVECKRREPVSF